jgi:predicted  nucleic acid-binding Zn-ribbon protein
MAAFPFRPVTWRASGAGTVGCRRCGRHWCDGSEPILRRCPCGAFLSNRPTTMRGMAKRGYSREFTPQTDRRVRFEVDRIPPTLYEAVKAKAKREGVSLRALTLRLWKQWLDAATGAGSSE